jgi:transcriptional regulator with XRE-family HTH domain
LADLATRSGVSKAMISRIERGETSPTAVLLSRLSGAFEMTLSALLARAEADAAGAGRVARAGSQRPWRDPATGYVRQAITPPGTTPEMVRVSLPPATSVAFPALSFAGIEGQCVWVLSGALEFHEGATVHHLAAGDCLALGPPTACRFVNPSPDRPCDYVVGLARRR